MYPSLYYLFADLFHIKLEFLKMVQTFGFFLAISFLSASYTVSKELKRKEKDGLIHSFTEKIWKGKPASVTELIESFIIAFILGYKLLYIALNFHSFVNDTQGFVISRDGNLIGGLIAGIAYTFFRYREKEKQKLSQPIEEVVTVHPYQIVGNITLIAAGAGILGAKVFDALENFGDFLQHPIETIFSFSGLTVYGGLLFGAFAVVYYTRKKGIPILHMIDAGAPSMMIAYAVGRIGCQMAGDGDWGIPNPAPKPGWIGFLPDWMWSFSYPHNVINEGVQIPGCTDIHCFALNPPVFPTPFYETVMGLILFSILWWGLRKRIKAPGVMFCVYLVMNGVERFLIELIRVNVRYHIFGFSPTQAQIISPLCIIAGIIGIFYFRKKYAGATTQ
jgi:phosphatidylglycerol:prolipoprotein diacylglycerol transferase